MTVNEFIQKFVDAGWAQLGNYNVEHPDEFPVYYSMTPKLHELLTSRGLPKWGSLFIVKHPQEASWILYVWTPPVEKHRRNNSQGWAFTVFMLTDLDVDIESVKPQYGMTWDRIDALIEYLGVESLGGIDDYVDLDNIVF